MKFRFVFCVVALLLYSNKNYGQQTINTMFYNISSFPEALPDGREHLLKEILSEYSPDIFLVSEIQNQGAADLILNTSLKGIGKNYATAKFHEDQSLNTSMYYNSDYFILDKQENIPTVYRDINHYTFILKTANYLSKPTYLEVFTSHFRYSSGTKNEQTRLKMAKTFTEALEELDPKSYVLFGGDFNFYTSNDPAYQHLLNDGNAIIMKDILNLKIRN